MKLIHHYNNAADGVEARIFKHPGGKLHVALYDTDAGETLSSIKIFPQAMKRAAFEYARKIAGPGALPANPGAATEAQRTARRAEARREIRAEYGE